MFLISSSDPSTYTSQGYILDTKGINAYEQLMLYNDSPYGLQLILADKSTDVLPAYWNKDFIINQPMDKVTIIPVYSLNNPTQYPISSLYGTLYEKEERVASVNASMNRGIVVTNSTGIPVNQQSSTLLNRGNAPGTNVINLASTSNASDTAVVTNDGLWTLDVTIAGALVQFLKTAITDPILSLGAVSHLVEVLGNLTVDGTTTLTGVVTANNASNAIAAKTLLDGANLPGGLGRSASSDIIQISTTDVNYRAAGSSGTNVNARVQGKGTGRTYLNSGSVDVLYVDGNNGLIIPVGKIGTASAGDRVDWSGNNFYAKGAIANAGFVYQAPSGTTVWSRTQESTFTGTGSGTYNHNCGGTPNFISPVCNAASSSQTFGVASITTTQCTVTTGAGLAFIAKAERF